MRIVCESKMLYQTNMHDDISKLDPHIFNWKLNQRWIKSEQKASQLKVKIHHTSCMAHAQNPTKQTRKNKNTATASTRKQLPKLEKQPSSTYSHTSSKLKYFLLDYFTVNFSIIQWQADEEKNAFAIIANGNGNGKMVKWKWNVDNESEQQSQIIIIINIIVTRIVWET